MATRKRPEPHRVELFQPQSLPREFFLKEYERLFSEIREINKITVDYVRVFIAFGTSVFIYSFGGFLYYKELATAGKFYFAYSLFGTLLMLMVIMVTAIVFFQLANSKKIKVRYWRSIDILRTHIKNKFSDYTQVLPFSPEITGQHFRPKTRPNVTTAETYAYVVMGFLCELMWLVVLVYFVTNMLESWGSIDKGRLLKAMTIANFLLILMLVLGPHQGLSIRKTFKEARLISADDFYPEYPSGVHSRKLHYCLLSYGFLSYFVLLSLVFLTSDIKFANPWFFGYAFSLLFLSNLYSILVASFYVLQKKISSDGIQEFRSHKGNNPLATWKGFVKLQME
jgi:hypothetical protein